MTDQAHIETITKGPSQRIRRTIGYRVVAGGKEIARFDADPVTMGAALAAARRVLEELSEKD